MISKLSFHDKFSCDIACFFNNFPFFGNLCEIIVKLLSPVIKWLHKNNKKVSIDRHLVTPHFLDSAANVQNKSHCDYQINKIILMYEI